MNIPYEPEVASFFNLYLGLVKPEHCRLLFPHTWPGRGVQPCFDLRVTFFLTGLLTRYVECYGVSISRQIDILGKIELARKPQSPLWVRQNQFDRASGKVLRGLREPDCAG